MKGRKSAVKSCLNFVIDFIQSAFGNSLATLDTHWKFSFLILSIQTITFLKLVLLLLSTCKKLCEHLCKLQHRRRRILGSRGLSYPCLQRVCVQPSPLFLHHALWISCSTTSLLTTSRDLSCWFYVWFCWVFLSLPCFFEDQMYSFILAAGFIKQMVSDSCGILWVISRNTAVGGLTPSKSVSGVVRRRENRVMPVILFASLQGWYPCSIGSSLLFVADTRRKKGGAAQSPSNRAFLTAVPVWQDTAAQNTRVLGSGLCDTSLWYEKPGQQQKHPEEHT